MVLLNVEDLAMIEFTRGDILAADVEALVNTVNCVGVMGRGIALQFRNAFPENFKAYEAACRREEVQPGRMFVFPTGQLTNPRFIINFPTKRHWKGKSRLADIDAGLKALVEEVQRLGIRSIAVPPLGCGLGGLEWSEVRPQIERALSGLEDVRTVVYEPAGAPIPTEMARSKEAPPMTPGRAVLVELMQRYLSGLMDPFVSLLEVHKLMYFTQEAGEPLRLRYVKAPYGPYAKNLRHVLAAIEGHFVSGYSDGEDAPNKQLELVPGALNDASSFLSTHPETSNRFDRVADLVEGFETPFGLELLATVHWVGKHEGVRTADTAIDAVYSWNGRKRRFSERQIRLAWDILATKGWLPETGGALSDRRAQAPL
jgi:O-acetyl-ADP-ribose deacetylase (regulator of RNase III)